jgi:hypothetical protein
MISAKHGQYVPLLILCNLASRYYYKVLLRLLLSTSSITITITITISSIQTTPGDRPREAPDRPPVALSSCILYGVVRGYKRVALQCPMNREDNMISISV